MRELSKKLTEIQQGLGEAVRSTMHVHRTHHLGLGVIVMRGPADVLQRAAGRILPTKGVVHGGLELMAEPVMLEAADAHAH